jgi:hypothetical protein
VLPVRAQQPGLTGVLPVKAQQPVQVLTRAHNLLSRSAVYILDYTGLLYLTLGELREECLSRWWKEKKRRVIIHDGI